MRINVSLHLLANKPPILMVHFSSVSVDYKPTASEAQRKDASTHHRLLNQALLEGVNSRLADVAQRYGARVRYGNGVSKLPVIDISVLDSKTVCSDNVCRSFMETKSDLLDRDGHVLWTYKSRIELPLGAIPDGATAFEDFANDLLTAMKRDGAIAS